LAILYCSTDASVVSCDKNARSKFEIKHDDGLSSVRDPLRRVRSSAYDALSRKASVWNLAVQANPLVAMAYTPDGLIASPGANSNQMSFAHGGFDRLSIQLFKTKKAMNLLTIFDADVRRRKQSKLLRNVLLLSLLC
jgi:hypothetical protein